MVVALLTALTSTSLFAQTTEAPPLDIESYTTPIDVQNVDQVERLLVKQFADYQWVDEFAMDATGRVVAVSGRNSDSGDYSIIVWNPDTGDTRTFNLKDGLSLPDDAIDRVDMLAVSPDGTRLVACCIQQGDQTLLRMWDIPSGDTVFTEMSLYVSALEFSPDGTYLVAVLGALDIAWWDVATGAKVNTISYRDYDLQRTEDDFPPEGAIRDVFITSDNRMYFGQRGGIYEWNLETNALEHMYALSSSMRIPDAPPDAMPRGLPAYPEFPAAYNIVSIAVSPDEHYIATGHPEGLLIWDTQDPVWGMSFELWDEAITRVGADEIEFPLAIQFNVSGDLLFATDNGSVFAISTVTQEILAEYYYPWYTTITQAALNEAGTLVYVNSIHFGLAVFGIPDSDAPPFELPPSTEPGGRCQIEFESLSPAYLYTLPVAHQEYLREVLEPPWDVTLVGRLPDNSWWQVDYRDWRSEDKTHIELWLSSRDIGLGAIVTGDCDDLPVVLLP